MDRTPVRTEPEQGPDGVAEVSRADCAAAGLCGGFERPTDGAAAGLCGGEAAPSMDGLLTALDGAQSLVAMASQLPLAGADDDVLAQVIAVGGRLRSAVEALLLAATAAMEASRTGSGRAALRNEARMSSRSASRKAAVSEQISKMPNVARGLACGALAVEHAEVLADTARRCSPGVVDVMPDLLETAAKASPDVLRREARAFVAQYDPAAAESQLSRQRRERSAALFIDEETGMGVLNARFDPVNFALVRQAVENYNDALWRLDGGRDGTPDAVRDNRQRLADSVFEMLAGRRALDVFLDPAAVAPSSVPDALLAGAGNAVDVGTVPDGRCDVLGAGPVPKSILDDLSPDTRITGALFGGSGQPLWLGRSRRLASVAQQLAVAIRDRGCVLCGAPMHRCKYHHIDEWDADHGATDIPNLAALCNDCHNSLHKGGQRLCRDPVSGHWSTQKRPNGLRRGAVSDSHRTGEPSRLDGKTTRFPAVASRGPP